MRRRDQLAAAGGFAVLLSPVRETGRRPADGDREQQGSGGKGRGGGGTKGQLAAL